MIPTASCGVSATLKFSQAFSAFKNPCRNVLIFPVEMNRADRNELIFKFLSVSLQENPGLIIVFARRTVKKWQERVNRGL